MKMTAANGTEIPNKGCKVVEFVGSEPVFGAREPPMNGSTGGKT